MNDSPQAYTPSMEQRDLARALVEHPGWNLLLERVQREMRGVRRTMFHFETKSVDELALTTAQMRGSAAICAMIFGEFYKAADIVPPAWMRELFTDGPS